MPFHSPLLWAAVLLGSFSAAFAGYYLASPFADRAEAAAASIRLHLPRLRAVSRRGVLPAMVVLFSVGFVLWTIHYPAEGIFFLAGTAVIAVLVKRFPRWRKNRIEQDRRRRCLEVFPQALEMTVQTLQVGQTLPQAVSYLSREAPQPLRDEFAAVSMEMELGASPEDALAKLAARLDHPDLSRFLEAYRFSRRAGANLVHLYRTQLEGIEERHRLLRRLDSMTAQARLSGLLMGSLPVMLLAVLFVMDSDLLVPLFRYPAGWAVLALAVILETLGFLWIQKLLKVEV